MLILASNSPRRREMLDWLGMRYIAKAAQIDETPHAGEAPLEYVDRVSRAKADAFADDGQVRLGADTIVVFRKVILGKPVDREEARRMLKRLRGNRHQVHTALWLYSGHACSVREVCTSEVGMRSFSDEEMEEYVISGDPMDKAGAYAIQHGGFHPVEHFNGCMANVMGLPMCHLKRGLKGFGIEIEPDIQSICQRHLQYDCNISSRVLSGEDIG